MRVLTVPEDAVRSCRHHRRDRPDTSTGGIEGLQRRVDLVKIVRDLGARGQENVHGEIEIDAEDASRVVGVLHGVVAVTIVGSYIQGVLGYLSNDKLRASRSVVMDELHDQPEGIEERVNTAQRFMEQVRVYVHDEQAEPSALSIDSVIEGCLLMLGHPTTKFGI